MNETQLNQKFNIKKIFVKMKKYHKLSKKYKP